MNMNLISIILLIVVFFSIRSVANNDVEFMNKENTDAIRGLSMLSIFFNHYCQIVQNNTYLGQVFMYSGSIAVGFFFFISGYANYLSIERNKYGVYWLKKRIINILSATLIIIIIYCAQAYFRDSNYYNIPKFIIGGRWYFKVLLISYIILYLDLTYIKKYNLILLWIISFSYIFIMKKLQFPSFWYNSILCFPLGIILAKYKESFKKYMTRINTKLVIIPFLIVFLILDFKVVQNYYKYEIIVSISFVALVMVFSYYFKFKSKILAVIGKYSIGIYLCHGEVIKILYQDYKMNNNYKMFFTVIIITGLISYVVKLIIDKFILNKIIKKRLT